MKEEWKPIPGFSRYEASTLGNLRSINYKNSGKVKNIKPCLSDGYLKTMLQDDSGKYKTWNVHKFVALAFLGTCPKGMEVNHKKGIKTDNRPSELEYCSRSANVKHSFDFGLAKPSRGSINGNHKLTESDVIEIRKTAEGKRYYGRKALAEKFGVSEAHIKDIVTRRRNVWYHV